MLGASHLIAGAATGALCRRAWIAVPVAFASHFVLDQVPHSCFNELPASAWSMPAVLLVIAVGIAAYAAAVWAIVLAWRLGTRWVSIAAAVAAFAPDPLCYWRPFNEWFALVPGSSCVPWAHNTFHCDVTSTHVALGFATQAVVIAAALYVLARRRAKLHALPRML